MNKTFISLSLMFAYFFINIPMVHSQESNNYYWYDGKKKRKLKIDKTRRVEFCNIKQKNCSSKTSTVSQSLILEKNYHQANLFKAIGSDLNVLISKTAGQNSHYSEVFSSGNNIRALPGGILVSFKSDWDEETIRQWAKKQQLSVNKQLLKITNLWLINTPIGIESLNLANKITEQGEVNHASPNWWQPLSKK